MKTNKAYIPFISRKVLQRQTRKVLQPLNGISLGLGLLLTAGVAPVVSAITLDINPEIEADWTNTLKYSLGARTGSKNKTNLNNSNADDSERNFDRGSLVMNRVDWLSELNFKYQNYSLNLSGAAGTIMSTILPTKTIPPVRPMPLLLRMITTLRMRGNGQDAILS